MLMSQNKEPVKVLLLFYTFIVTKPEIIFDETNTIKKRKVTKLAHAFKNHRHFCNVEFFEFRTTTQKL